MRTVHSLALLAAFLIPSVDLTAGPLKEASINQIINDVKVIDPKAGARPAALKETIRDEVAVRTGIKSRAELLFQDQTLTRLGGETFFSFTAGTRDLSLERGTMLLQVPKGLGGARIRTASVTASITGTTIMIEHEPKKHLKVLVLEGSLRLSNGRFGDSVLLTPGKMVIMSPQAKRIPEPINIDLRKVVRTSSLIDPVAFKGNSKANVAALPSIGLIEKEVALQSGQIKDRGLIATDLVIPGNGTEVVVASPAVLAKLEQGVMPGTAAAGLPEKVTLPARSGTVPVVQPSVGSTGGGSESPPTSGGVVDFPVSAPLPTSPTPGIPTVAVITPTSPVSTPTVPVSTTTSPVITPTVPVITPTVPVITPTVPVVTPTTPVVIPTTPVVIPTTPVVIPTTPVVIPTTPVVIPTTPVVIPTTPVVIPTTPVVIPTTPVVIPTTPVVIPTTPVVIPTTPVVIPTTPVVIPTTPVVIPTTPVVTPTTPVVIPTTPVVIPTTPVVIPTTPVVIPTTPVVIPTTPVVVPTTPVVTPTTPVVTPTTPVVTPTTPVVTPTTPVVTPTTPVVTPTTPVVTPTVPVVTPTVPVVTPTVPVVTPTVPVVTPTTPVVTPGFEIVNAESIRDGDGLNRIGSAAVVVIGPGSGGFVDLRGPKIEIDSGEINGINLSGGTGGLNLLQQGGDGGFLQAGTALAPIAGEIEVEAAINVTTGANSLGVAYGGVGGTVQMVAEKEIVVKSAIRVSSSNGSAASRSGGNITLESRSRSTAIKIEDSAQILSLLANQAPGSGGTITFYAPNGKIEVNDSTVQADRGTVSITSGAADENVVIKNSTISGDVVKIGALGANGELRIGGGTISAETALKLYAPGTNGTVRFNDNVTLGGQSVKTIAGRTVAIDSGKVVTIGGSGPARVYTDVPNYTGSGGNGSSSGRFGGQGATTEAFGSRPGF